MTVKTAKTGNMMSVCPCIVFPFRADALLGIAFDSDIVF